MLLNTNPFRTLNTSFFQVDILAYAMDNPAPSTIVLISGDRDFAYALSILRLRRYHIVLITLSNAHPSLKAQASLCFNWISDASGTIDPTSVLQQHTSPRKRKTSIPPSHDRFQSDSDTKTYNLSKFPFQEPYDDKPANSVKPINYVQDKAKCGGDICLTPPKRDFRPDLSPPELEPSMRLPAASMSSTNLRNGTESPKRVIHSPVASSGNAPSHLNDSIKTPLIMTESSHDSNSSQVLPPSNENIPKLALHGDLIASRFHTPISLRGSTSLPNLVLEQEVDGVTEPVSFESALQTQTVPAKPDLREFSPSPQQSLYSTKSFSVSAVNQIYDPDGNPDSSPVPYINVATSLPTPSFTPPSSLNHISTTTTTTMPTTSAQNPNKIKTTNPASPKPPPLATLPSTSTVPDKFKILVECLKSYRSKGIFRPLRTLIAIEIAHNGTTYRQAGVTKFREYAAIAEKEGIIALGGWQGTAWIALLEPWI